MAPDFRNDRKQVQLDVGQLLEVKRKHAILLSCAAGTAIAYLAGPILAAILQSGEREGPRIYPVVLHETLYILVHESVHNVKPRRAIDASLYDRPWFYGMEKVPKPQSERDALMKRIEKKEGYIANTLRQRNAELNRRHVEPSSVTEKETRGDS